VIITDKECDMPDTLLEQGVGGRRLHLVGIKGVGMTALAEILLARGADITGSDTPEKFYTDIILAELGIPVTEGFAADNVRSGTELVIYSAAYPPDRNPELKRAGELGIPCLSYPEALGRLSALFDAAGVCGVHGKTTTTALTGMLCKLSGLPATVLVGSEVPGFGNRSTYLGGDRYLVAETCEYKRHFLNFFPSRIILTSIEEDHQDYFKDIEDLFDAFTAYLLRLKQGGALIYCADDPGVRTVIERIRPKRPDLRLIPYGFTAAGDYRISGERFSAGTTCFRLDFSQAELSLHVPGRHTILNAAAAVALVRDLARAEGRPAEEKFLGIMARALAEFNGTRRRSEIIGEAVGILFMDDYAHHPTAIRTTLAGLKEYYPDRRLVVDFMSHTYSRTRALLKEFSESFDLADVVVLNKIYASAREQNDGSVDGRTLFDLVRAGHPAAHYHEELDGAMRFLKENLAPGDLFITMGAGDNWKLSHDLYRYYSTVRSST
jgi:UDP-N-acetylmuramate--alanine ligase